jgi:phage terminase small subunit
MKEWWAEVTTEYVLQAHHLRLLEACCSAWDRLTEAREVLTTEGLTVATRYGRKAHPAVSIERDSKMLFARLLRELDLDTEPPTPDRSWRPPLLHSNRRR